MIPLLKLKQECAWDDWIAHHGSAGGDMTGLRIALSPRHAVSELAAVDVVRLTIAGLHVGIMILKMT